jgi:hypothetical protein
MTSAKVKKWFLFVNSLPVVSLTPFVKITFFLCKFDDTYILDGDSKGYGQNGSNKRFTPVASDDYEKVSPHSKKKC